MLMSRVCLPMIRAIPALLLLAAASGPAFADPPSRVVRLSYVSGDVSLQPAGIDEWVEARINRPLTTGDSLYADRASRVEMEIGAATVRLDERTSFRVLNLDDDIAQIELTDGTLNLIVRRVFEGQSYEVDTPTLALVIDQPGQYRVDVAPRGDSTMVSVIDGGALVYGQNNASYRVRDGQSYRFYDSSLTDYEVFDLPRQDDFDRWCFERADRYRNSPSRRYVSEEVIGYADLDDYGTWSTAPSYGSVWYPSRVDAGWAPYRNGHWSWIDPWGWTWVDDAPWGFAPFHYGRWAYVGSRWGWIPGPRAVRPIYAPALVAFVGGSNFSVSISSGGPVGWFPLGPRDVYVPWYGGSRTYFNNINVRNTTIINNTYITNVYNDYSRGRPVTNFNYAYRDNNRAFTAISRDAFVNARSVERSRVQVAQAQLARGQVMSRIEVAPTPRSFVGGSVARNSGGRAVREATFDRQVIARTAPPARSVDAQTRIQAISRNNNQPLAASEMRDLSARKPQAERGERRIQVVGGERSSTPPQALPQRGAADARGDSERSGRIRSTDGREAGAPTPAARSERSTGYPRGSTERAPRADDNARTRPEAGDSPSLRGGRTIRSEDAARPPAAAREPATRRDSAPTTVRAPIRTEAEGNNRLQRSEGGEQPVRGRNIQPQPVEERSAPVREQRAPVIERRAVPQREPQDAAPQRQSAPQQRDYPQQRATPERVPREVQPRSAPAPQAQPQPREIQQREVQQRPQRTAPPQRADPPPANDKREQKNDDEDNKDERKRRERY